MAETDWYEVTNGDVVLQGDILFDCPVALVLELPWPVPDDFRPAVDVRSYDLVVMTQSCDLENDKVEDILFSQVIDWQTVLRPTPKDSHLRSTKFRRVLIDGNVPGLSLLHKREQAPQLPWSIVDFHKLFSLPKGFVKKVAAKAGPRLRLRSPYREHLAQGFARYFMRVGLPHDASAFEHEGKPEG
jgi:hypothetical protein